MFATFLCLLFILPVLLAKTTLHWISHPIYSAAIKPIYMVLVHKLHFITWTLTYFPAGHWGRWFQSFGFPSSRITFVLTCLNLQAQAEWIAMSITCWDLPCYNVTMLIFLAWTCANVSANKELVIAYSSHYPRSVRTCSFHKTNIIDHLLFIIIILYLYGV